MAYEPRPILTTTPGPAPIPERSHRGYVYVLSNPSMPGQVKIGRTERNPITRRDELSRATGVPTPFVLESWELFADCWKAEKDVHRELQRLGQRVSNDREFFWVSVSQANAVLKRLAALEHGVDPGAPPSRQARAASDDQVDRGVKLLFGLDGQMRDARQALSNFEQAAALGSARGRYYSGRAAHVLANDARPKDRPELDHRAQHHYQTAMAHPTDPSRVAAAGWSAKLFWQRQQYGAGEKAWNTFLERAAQLDQPSNDVLTLLLDQIEFSVKHRKLWRCAAVEKHRDALLAAAKPSFHTLAIVALRRVGQPWWRWPLFVAVDVFRWSPVALTGLALTAALYVALDGWWWVLALLTTVVAGWFEHRPKQTRDDGTPGRYPRRSNRSNSNRTSGYQRGGQRSTYRRR
ncbi:GIY-YIG nuclease family protein [Burkholderia gladioli]|uniref:GIY-YIG nuclease family protein n=1 Tax=Burkholderia gladioli TaxID=28095 RepID=UPI000D00621D|nr:GIY-YIG nuclease family protein [Burkholderia gladioli]PRE86668.1 hypothetical protein C6Q13_14510 [Burkholderia gladioli]